MFGLNDGKDALKKSISIVYRSSTQIAGVDATVKYQAVNSLLRIDRQAKTDDDEAINIPLNSIENLKAKDYLEDDNFCWVLALILADGTQHSLQYRQKEDRDAWTTALRIVLGGDPGVAKAAEEEKGVVYAKITEVVLKEPGADVLCSASISLERNGEASSGMIFVPDMKSSAESIRQITQDFISGYGVDPKESTSLYRFLRTVVQRSLCEKETAAIVEEIQRNNLETILKEASDAGKEVDLSEMKVRVQKRLNALKEDVQRRLGEQGTGTNVLVMMLRNNIEKMSYINQLTAKAKLMQDAAEDAEEGEQ